jgi:hypothetical protein
MTTFWLTFQDVASSTLFTWEAASGFLGAIAGYVGVKWKSLGFGIVALDGLILLYLYQLGFLNSTLFLAVLILSAIGLLFGAMLAKK